MLLVALTNKILLSGKSSGLDSLYLTPREYDGEDSWILLSAFSTSYAPGAEERIIF